jgi:hypothetical protein
MWFMMKSEEKHILDIFVTDNLKSVTITSTFQNSIDQDIQNNNLATFLYGSETQAVRICIPEPQYVCPVLPSNQLVPSLTLLIDYSSAPRYHGVTNTINVISYIYRQFTDYSLFLCQSEAPCSNLTFTHRLLHSSYLILL